MRSAPEKIPALPKPDIARPTIRTSEVRAMPLTKDPSSNVQMADMYTYDTGMSEVAKLAMGLTHFMEKKA
jgi:hypothetical protein